jgi:HlyD family secretion protein
MPHLFPPEIIENSVENYYAKISNRRKTIYWLLLLLVAAVLVSLPLVHIDITSQSRGLIRTAVENTVIQPVVYGEVTVYNMSENKTVQAGDTLIVINTELLEEQMFLEKQKLEENLLFCEDLKMLTGSERKKLQTSKYQSAYYQYLSKIRELDIQIKYCEKEYETAKTLYQQQTISEFDLLQQKNSLEKVQSQKNSLQNEYTAAWKAEETRLLLENHVLESNIKRLETEKRQYVITAPVSGNLVQVAGFQTGNFIAPNQVLAHISSADSLLVECYVSPLDIGYIYQGQAVKLQLDAFDYRQWGFIEGEVTDILEDVVAVEGQPVFRVRCRLYSHCLELKNGYRGCVKKGLSLTARFTLNRRSLGQLLFDKIDQWMNPKIIK